MSDLTISRLLLTFRYGDFLATKGTKNLRTTLKQPFGFFVPFVAKLFP